MKRITLKCQDNETIVLQREGDIVRLELFDSEKNVQAEKVLSKKEMQRLATFWERAKFYM